MASVLNPVPETTSGGTNLAPAVSLYPPQGHWTITDWANLPDDSPRCELVDGCLEILPVPTNRHLWIQEAVYEAFRKSLGPQRVKIAGYKIQTAEQGGRIPDVLVYLKPPDRSAPASEVTERPDLVVEVISPGSRQRHRDLVEKRGDYAAVGIREYWIVDPELETITVLSTQVEETHDYEIDNTYRRGDSASSHHVDTVAVDVASVFDIGNGIKAIDS